MCDTNRITHRSCIARFGPLMSKTQSSRLTKGWFSKRVVLVDVPLERKPERGHIRMFPRTKTGTRLRSHVARDENRSEGTCAKPPFYETALLFPLEKEHENSRVECGVQCETLVSSADFREKSHFQTSPFKMSPFGNARVYVIFGILSPCTFTKTTFYETVLWSKTLKGMWELGNEKCARTFFTQTF